MQVDLPDGLRMPVVAWGDAATDAVPVVCLHSLFFTGEMFAAVAPTLAADRSLHAPTYRGHAGLATGGKAPVVEQLARDILDWMDGAGLDSVHLIGSSMGAYVAMEMLRDHGDRIASVTLACCTGEAEATPERFAKLADCIASGPTDTSAAVIAGIMFGADSLAAPTPPVRHWIERFAQVPATMGAAVTAMFAHPGYAAPLQAYRGPVLLLAGAQDHAKSVADMERIAALLPQAETHIFETAGHTPAVEAPEAFAARVLQFITRAEAAAEPSRPASTLQTTGSNHVA